MIDVDEFESESEIESDTNPFVEETKTVVEETKFVVEEYDIDLFIEAN